MKMLKFTLMLLLAATFMGDLAAQNIAVIIKIRGDVFVTPDQSTRSERARKGQVLKSGDKLETAASSSCAIKFLDDKSLLRLKEKSTCIIEGKKKDDAIEKNIFAQVGSFFASLFEPKGKFQVTTPTSVASVKGTEFWVLQSGQNGTTKYITTEGTVEVENSAGKVLVKEGQTAIVQSRSRRPEVRLTNSGEIPTDENRGAESKTLDVEFEDANGEKRVLRIELEG